MIATRNVLSALAIMLAAGGAAGEAQAQFGMGMGMRGPMGMGMGMGMGMRGPMGMGPMGMGSRSMYLSSPPAGYRRSHRSRDFVEDEPAPRQAKHKKHAPPAAQAVAPAKAVAPKIAGKSALPAKTLPQYQPAAATQSVLSDISRPVQPAQANPVPQSVATPVQPAQQPQTVAPVAAASADSALPTRLTPDTRPLNCTTKLHLKDGTVLLQDFCTLEQHVIKQPDKPQSQAVTPAPAPAPQQQQKGGTPAQLARNR